MIRLTHVRSALAGAAFRLLVLGAVFVFAAGGSHGEAGKGDEAQALPSPASGAIGVTATPTSTV